MWSESRRFLAGGVASSLRSEVKPVPLFVERGEGAEILDVDGNRLIDFTMAYGPLILGHAPAALTRAVNLALERGSTFGAQHAGEIELARRLQAVVPNADLVCLSGSGTEAVMVALRLARAHTGRTRVIRFGGHYHGWSDSVLVGWTGEPTDGDWEARPSTAGQSLNALKDLVVLPWNDLRALESFFAQSGGEVAAVLCEPVLANSGCIAPVAGYLERMRELSDLHGAVLIFDEVITGFRLALGGAQERLGVNSDLALFGKALSGGFQLSAITGSEQILGLVAAGTVSHMGTLNGNTVSTAAALATLEELARDDGAVYRRMAELGAMLTSGIADSARQHGIPLVINSASQFFQTIFTEEQKVCDFGAFSRRDTSRGSRFAEMLMYEGVYVRPSGLWYLSTAHEEDHIGRTVAAVDRVLQKLS
jgi:glutamate-1-semialdehyde 2,1-aminomutase